MADQQVFASVWDAIEDTPHEAERMKFKSALLAFVQHRIRALELTQVQAAELLEIQQPRVSDLMRGKIDVFSADALVEYASHLGLHFEVTALEDSGQEFALA